MFKSLRKQALKIAAVSATIIFMGAGCTAMQNAGKTGPVASDFNVGDTVGGKFTDGNYYVATITAVDNGTYTLKYFDGDEGTNTLEELLFVSKNPILRPGDKVLAVWPENQRFYPATVKQTGGNKVTVAWDDGSDPTELEFGKVTYFQEGKVK